MKLNEIYADVDGYNEDAMERMLTEALRGADTIPQQARELLIPVRQEYARIRAALEELDT